MKRWLLFAVVLLPALSSAKGPAITSTYTKLDLDRCKEVDHGEEWTSWRCRGYAGIPLFVQNGDERYDVDAGREDEESQFAPAFDYPGSTVEWRLSKGRPFAIIYRLSSANPDLPKSSRLIVETIGRSSPGCRIASIDGAVAAANAQARRAADAILTGAAHCLK
jgi:hypothetical protein